MSGRTLGKPGNRRRLRLRQRAFSWAALGVVVLATIGLIGHGEVAAAGFEQPVVRQESQGTGDGQGSAVAVAVVTGIEGTVTTAQRVPVRLTLSSQRARSVEVELRNSNGSQFYEAELNADAPTTIDAVMQAPVDLLEVVVRDGAGDKLASTEHTTSVDISATVVGVGESIAPGTDSFRVDSIAGIQEVTVVPFTDGLLDQPGVLDMMSGVVLGPADLDRLTADQGNRISAWTASGGNLAFDQARVDPLPLLGVAAGAGNWTAVEAGWVRFTDGAVARGDWSMATEPAVINDSLTADRLIVGEFGFDDFGFQGSSIFDQQLRQTGFIQISYLPGWVVVSAVFSTALLVGPVLWLLLRTRRRRRLMWVLAPGLSMLTAVTLLIGGQGVLSDASGDTVGSSISTGWGNRGEFGLGVTSGQPSVELGSAGQVWASSPRASVSGSGEDRQTVQQLGTNEFGYLGVGLVPVGETPLISIEAMDLGDGKLNVQVTNGSQHILRNVSVAGFTRSQDFPDIAPGESVPQEFSVSENLNIFGSMFNALERAEFCAAGFCTGPDDAVFARAGFFNPSARGLVEVRGTLHGPQDVGGHTRQTTMAVLARAPVVPGAAPPSGAVLRIDSVGTPPRQNQNVDQGFIVNEDPGLQEFPGGLSGGETTTTALGVEEPGQQNPPPLEPIDLFARLSSPVDMAPMSCAIHTILENPEVWNVDRWEPLRILGDPVLDPRFVEPNQVRPYELPALAAGEPRYLRLKSPLGLNAANAILCGVAP